MTTELVDTKTAERRSARPAPVTPHLPAQDLRDLLPAIEPERGLTDWGRSERVEAFLDKTTWHSKCVKNISKMGRFSSDRTIREYATEIWGAEQVKIRLRPYHDPTT